MSSHDQSVLLTDQKDKKTLHITWNLNFSGMTPDLIGFTFCARFAVADSTSPIATLVDALGFFVQPTATPRLTTALLTTKRMVASTSARQIPWW
jgi:hypothetical protein